MPTMRRYRSLVAVVLAVSVASCGRDAASGPTTTSTTSTSMTTTTVTADLEPARELALALNSTLTGGLEGVPVATVKSAADEMCGYLADGTHGFAAYHRAGFVLEKYFTPVTGQDYSTAAGADQTFVAGVVLTVCPEYKDAADPG